MKTPDESPDAPALGPEAELLLAAASVAPPETRAERVHAALGRPLDGEFLVQCSLKNRIVPLVREAVRAAGPAVLEEGARAELDRWANHVQLQNLSLLREMLLLVEELESIGVRASPYKGPVLAARLYEDLGLRQYYDLDLMVREKDLERASERILARGYEPSEEDQGPVEEDCERHFHHPSDGRILELHWEALPRRHRFGYELDETWERLVPLELGGRTVEVLGPEDELLALCVHGGEKHRWMRLQMIADVARVLRARELDWDVLEERARALGREDTVLLGVFLAWALLDAPLPPGYAGRVREGSLLTRGALTLERLFRLDSGQPDLARWRGHVAWLVGRARELGEPPRSVPGAPSYLAAVLRPEWTDRQAVGLPPGLGCLYWVVRPLRLLRRHGTGLLRRI